MSVVVVATIFFAAAPTHAQTTFSDAVNFSFGGAPLATLGSSALRLALAIFAFVMLLRAMQGVFLVLTHGGMEHRKEVAHSTLRGGLVSFAAAAVAVTLVTPALSAISSLASRYL